MTCIERRAAVAVVIVLAACNPASTPGGRAIAPGAIVPTATARGTPQGAADSATIGPAGGSLAVAGAVTVSVPQGSVAGVSTFTATPISSHAPGAIGTAYRIDTSEVLTGPVQLTFKGPASYPPGLGLRSLSIRFQDARGLWAAPQSVAYDVAANTLTATTPHLSDWAVVVDATPALEGTFTLDQSVGLPISATGIAALYAWSATDGDPTYYVTGTLSLPPEVTVGSAVCVPDAASQNLELSVAEVHAGKLRWGINARWVLTCTDGVTGAQSSQDVATVFDTMRINLTSCPGDYLGTQTSDATALQGRYATDCGSTGTVSASWDFRSCFDGLACQPPIACQTGVVACSGGVGTCTVTGTTCADGQTCGASGACT